MGVPTIFSLLYAVLSVVFVFTWDSAVLEDDALLGSIYFTVALLIHPLTGFLVPRLWALLLPFVAFVVSLPVNETVEPDWFRITTSGVMLIGGVIATILMSFGMACRLTLDALREPR